MVDQQNNAKANWTIMAYIAADDVLSDFAVGSLQQLRRLASENPNIVVAAQFDANGKEDILRLVFQGVEDKRKPIQDNKAGEIDSSTDVANPARLIEFINWAYQRYQANHYCLVLWGHGPELLANDYPVPPSGNRPKRFLTPVDIRTALDSTKLKEIGRKFEIVAIDACNMSMMEVACELQDHAEFLVASQEDVPDFSFPYDKLFTFSQANDQNGIAAACRDLPRRYIEAYKDYTDTQATQTASITLSSLSLKNIGTMTGLLGQLVEAFQEASDDREKRRAIIDARANSRQFVAGLYVDLYDFCEQLSGALFSKNIKDQKLMSACDKMRDAIDLRDDNAFVIANEASKGKKCHGISIYFPYLNLPTKSLVNEIVTRGDKGGGINYGQDAQGWSGTGPVTRGGMAFTSGGGVEPRDSGAGTSRTRGGLGFLSETDEFLSKGGLDLLSKGGLDLLSKGGLDLLSKGGLDLLSKMRRQRIEETERYYAGLQLSRQTQWYEFIRQHWSRWLVEDVEMRMKDENRDPSEALNWQYSAQQCALNLLSRCRELEAGGTSEDTGSADVQAGTGGPQKPAPPNGVATR
ncbi:MAG TPA: clostripain-related cysteine peptidase [Candidatus Angelobacter sp.]|nr:clostripain-related cysteine peptidase [Candidatus Angelobacter sp.]